MNGKRRRVETRGQDMGREGTWRKENGEGVAWNGDRRNKKENRKKEK